MTDSGFRDPSTVERMWWTAAFIWHLRRELRLPWQPFHRTRRLQDRRVRRIVRHAYRTVPFYRRAMDALGLAPGEIRTAADLAALPLIGGEELAADPAAFRSSRFSPRRTLEIPTTGTTGRWKPITHDRAALVAAYAAGWRWQAVVGALIGSSTAYRVLGFSPEGGTTAALRHAWSRLVWIPSRLDLDREPRSIAEPAAHSIAALNASKPAVVGGFGAHLGMLFRWAWEHDRPLALPRLVGYGGDTMAASDRALIEERYGVPVLSSYQACEALRIAYQCERRNGYHIFTDQVHLRIVGDDGCDVPAGETGEVVISNLVNRATVLLNYRLGDLAALASAACPCGRTLPLLERLDGRADDLLLTADGRRLHESVVLRRLCSVPGVVRLQVLQHDEGRATVRVVPAPDAARGVLCDALATALRELLANDGAEVAVECVDHIPAGRGGKYRNIVRARDETAPGGTMSG